MNLTFEQYKKLGFIDEWKLKNVLGLFYKDIDLPGEISVYIIQLYIQSERCYNVYYKMKEIWYKREHDHISRPIRNVTIKGHSIIKVRFNKSYNHSKEKPLYKL